MFIQSLLIGILITIISTCILTFTVFISIKICYIVSKLCTISLLRATPSWLRWLFSLSLQPVGAILLQRQLSRYYLCAFAKDCRWDFVDHCHCTFATSWCMLHSTFLRPVIDLLSSWLLRGMLPLLFHHQFLNRLRGKSPLCSRG